MKTTNEPDKKNKVSFISEMSPSWNITIEYYSILTPAKMQELTDWLIEKGGDGVICKDPLGQSTLQTPSFQNHENIIPIDLGYYFNDELLGYVSSVIGDGFFTFAPTDELRKQCEDVEDE